MAVNELRTDTARGEALIEALRTRFACKRYDPNGHISDSDFNTILEAARLSPSSFGFEPWKLLVIEDRGLLGDVLACSWGAKRNADRTVIILARRGVDAQSDWAHHIARDVQGLSKDDETARLQAFAGFQQDDLDVLENDRTASRPTSRSPTCSRPPRCSAWTPRPSRAITPRRSTRSWSGAGS